MRTYGIIGNGYNNIGVEVDTIIDSNKLHSLLDIMDNSFTIIVPTIKVLGDSLNMITNALNIIHDKEVTFKAIEEHIDSENVHDYEMFLINANMLNDIVLEKAENNSVERRIGGAKRGRRITFEFPTDFEEMYHEMLIGNVTKTDMAEHYQITRQSIYDWINRYEKMNNLGKYKIK